METKQNNRGKANKKKPEGALRISSSCGESCKIIALKGKLGSGKDTVAEIIKEQLTKNKILYQHLTFAENLRMCVKIFSDGKIEPSKTVTPTDKATFIEKNVFGKNVEEILRNLKKSLSHVLYKDICELEETSGFTGMPHDREETKMWLPRAFLLQMLSVIFPDITAASKNDFVPKHPEITIGRVLQLYGSDIVRNNFGGYTWALALRNELKSSHITIITDLRFPEELDMIQKNNCIIYNVQADKRLSSSRSDGRSLTHISETALDKLNDKTIRNIDNNGSLEQLRQVIDSSIMPELCQHLKI